MKKIIQKILLIPIFTAFLFYLTTISPVLALTMKGVPADYIKSPNGHVMVGFEREFGGAISYYRDDRIADTTDAQGNMLNNSNSGALFSTAIWTLKNFPGWSVPNRELGLGWCDKRTNKYFPKASAVSLTDWNANRIACYTLNLPGTFVPGSLPFNNPTQGGVGEAAWDSLHYGVNPNPLTFSISNNQAHMTTRLVDWNYSFEDQKPSAADTDLWQTDVWNEMDVYFHPQYPNVLVVDQKIAYCRDMNSGCRNQDLSFQDNQLSTLFPATTIYAKPFDGPISKLAFRVSGSYLTHAVGTTVSGDGVIENWQAALNSNNQGIGQAVYKFRSGGQGYVGKGEGYGSVGGGDALGLVQPDLGQFESSGIRPISSDPTDPRFTFSPGGWYKFRTFITTGDLGEIRRELLAVTDRKMDPDILTNVPKVASQITGYIDTVNCNSVGGWAAESGNNGYRVGISTEYTTVDGVSQYVKTTTANADRGDGGVSLKGACPPDGLCGYGITNGNFPISFKDKKIRVKVWATAQNGGIDLLKYSDGADSIIGPCSNIVVVPNNTPTPTPTYKPGDLNHDGHVDIFDYNNLVANFGKTDSAGFIPADINKDGKVDIFDYNVLVGNFNK